LNALEVDLLILKSGKYLCPSHFHARTLWCGATIVRRGVLRRFTSPPRARPGKW